MSHSVARIYGYGPSTGYASFSGNYGPAAACGASTGGHAPAGSEDVMGLRPVVGSNFSIHPPTHHPTDATAGQFASAEGMEDSRPCMHCFGMREPSFNTVIYGDTRKGFLPAGSYGFSQEGTVVDMLHSNGFPLQKGALLARTTGPIVGVTMGSCVSRASQSSILNYAGDFNPIPSSKARGCYI